MMWRPLPMWDIFAAQSGTFSTAIDSLRGVGLHEATVAVGQIQDQVVGLLLHPADDHQRFAEVALRMARRMEQRDEHLPGLTAALPYVVLDYGVLAPEPILIPQPLKDALGRVPLLLGDAQVFFQNPIDDAGERLLLSLSKGWAYGAGFVSGSPAARSRRPSCAPCPGAG